MEPLGTQLRNQVQWLYTNTSHQVNNQIHDVVCGRVRGRAGQLRHQVWARVWRRSGTQIRDTTW